MGDMINGAFESCGVFFIMLSIKRLRAEKEVKGVDWKHIAFFTTWGFWNLYYYPSLGQWFSWCGGLAITVANATWVVMLIYYGRRKHGKKIFQRFVD